MIILSSVLLSFPPSTVFAKLVDDKVPPSILSTVCIDVEARATELKDVIEEEEKNALFFAVEGLY